MNFISNLKTYKIESRPFQAIGDNLMFINMMLKPDNGINHKTFLNKRKRKGHNHIKFNKSDQSTRFF